MRYVIASILLCIVLGTPGAWAYTRDDLVRDYDGDCSFMESGIFTTTDIQWHSVEHKGYVMSIAAGEGDDGLIIKSFLPGEADLRATFDSGRGCINFPVQEWPFAGYEFCHGSSELQFSDDTPVVVRVTADPAGNAELIIDFPQGSWAVRDAEYGDYLSIIMAKSYFVAREKAPDGIEDATLSPADSDDAGLYYNLQGVRTDNPSHGIYIYVAGGKAKKVAVD